MSDRWCCRIQDERFFNMTLFIAAGIGSVMYEGSLDIVFHGIIFGVAAQSAYKQKFDLDVLSWMFLFGAFANLYRDFVGIPGIKG